MPVEQTLRKVSWSFAAAAQTIGEVPHAVQVALDVQVQRAFDNEKQIAQMKAAAGAITRLVESGLWGVGPFSLALSGTDHSFYLSVVSSTTVGEDDG